MLVVNKLMRYVTQAASCDIILVVFVAATNALASNAINIEAERIIAHPGHFDNSSD